MRRDPDEINAEIWSVVDSLIEDGHPGAAALDFDRNAIRVWFESKHPRGIKLKADLKESIRRRQGWSGPDEPISPADEELDPSGHLRPREGKDDITDMGGADPCESCPPSHSKGTMYQERRRPP